MKYFNPKFKKKLSFDNANDKLEIEKELYQQSMREKNIEKCVDRNHLENIFTNEIYYKAMKDIPKIEKQILYFCIYDSKPLNEICKILKISKTEIIKLKSLAIKHFKENVEKYKLAKTGCDENE